MDTGKLVLLVQNAMEGFGVAVVSAIVYSIIILIAVKAKKVKCVQKTSSVIVALFILVELIVGELWDFLGQNSFTYILIIAAVVTIVNNMTDVICEKEMLK